MSPRSWFKKRGGKDNFEFLFGDDKPVKFPEAISYLEIGVHAGGSMLWMADNVLNVPGSRGVGVDPYCPMHKQNQSVVDKRYEKMRLDLKPYENIKLVRDYSSRWLRKQSQPYAYDVIYIDGDHSAIFCLEDTVLAWPLLKTGGLLIWDDYSLVKRKKAVKSAADAFLSCLPADCHERIEAPSDYQAVVQKTGEVHSSEELPDGKPRLGTVI